MEIRTAASEASGQWFYVSVSNASTVHPQLPAFCSLDTSREIIRYEQGNEIDLTAPSPKCLITEEHVTPTNPPSAAMLRDCSPSLKSMYQYATASSIIRRGALVYLPTICVVSVFVALAWLGLSMNNQTYRNKELVVVITYFAALLVLECILLAHVAARRQKLSRLSQQPPCIESPPRAASATANTNGESSAPTSSTDENPESFRSQPRPLAPRASLVEVMVERPHASEPQLKNVAPPAFPLYSAGPHQSQKVPAICQPYHPSPMGESNRPLTAAAYIPQLRSLPVSPSMTPTHSSSWDLTMAKNNHHYQRTTAEHPASTPPPPELFQFDIRTMPFVEPPASVHSKATIQPERPATPDNLKTRSRQVHHSHVAALSPNVPPQQRTPIFPRAGWDGRGRQQPRQQPQSQSQSQSSGPRQAQPHPRTHSGLLEKNLIALAGA